MDPVDRGGRRSLTGWRLHLHEVIFEADTPLGKAFDVVLLLAIVLSVVSVVLESVGGIRVRHGGMLRAFEWGFTILFSGEYLLRLTCVARPMRYATSFFGLVDLLAVVPTYLSLFFVGTQSLLVIRVLRLLRIFRILKLAQFVREANLLLHALRASARKILAFLGAVLTLVLILGTAMYILEGGTTGSPASRRACTGRSSRLRRSVTGTSRPRRFRVACSRRS